MKQTMLITLLSAATLAACGGNTVGEDSVDAVGFGDQTAMQQKADALGKTIEAGYDCGDSKMLIINTYGDEESAVAVIVPGLPEDYIYMACDSSPIGPACKAGDLTVEENTIEGSAIARVAGTEIDLECTLAAG